ncbi:MAG TPA: hypothetical protein GX697_05145, partial [Firmicutes bacterium]|nr:hypothetical protein [Bacillota bacterium]
MLSSLIIAAGAPYKRGFAYGKAAARLIEENLLLFRSGLEASGSSPAEATALAEPATWSNLEALEEMAGIAAGAGVPFPELLAFNKYHTLVLPEECTVMMAVGKASGSGATIFMKNSDKVGDESLTGKNFYKYKEINIVLFIELENGTKIAGVAAAGSMGLKMGLNNKGIAAGANISRTKELAEKRVNITQIRALDRTQLLREGLEKDSLGEAVRLVAGKILDNPMATPGNLEFANAREAFIIEGSYDRVAVKKVVDDIDSRSN